jgi:hypothetical protein
MKASNIQKPMGRPARLHARSEQPEPRPKKSFLDLPSEIRNKIYEFYFSEEYPDEILVTDKRYSDVDATNFNSNLALYLLSKQIHEESLSLFYTCFLRFHPHQPHLDGLPALKRFITMCPREYRQYITGIFHMEADSHCTDEEGNYFKELDHIDAITNIIIAEANDSEFEEDGVPWEMEYPKNLPGLGITVSWLTYPGYRGSDTDNPYVLIEGAIGKLPLDKLLEIPDSYE